MVSPSEQAVFSIAAFGKAVFQSSPTMSQGILKLRWEGGGLLGLGAGNFAGTRIAVKTLFDHLKAGDLLEVFLNDFPSVSRELALAVLEEAGSG